MKCPECGSDLVREYDLLVCENHNCNNLDVLLAPTVEQQLLENQQRLDNVLKHFEDNEHKYQWINLFRGIDITYNRFDDNKFLLWNIFETIQYSNNAYKQISLDTVESLLKDLGVIK